MSAIAQTTTVTTAERERLMAKPVTLNGRPALISGRLSLFAVVRTNDRAPAYVGEWAWHAVRRIVASGGAFTI